MLLYLLPHVSCELDNALSNFLIHTFLNCFLELLVYAGLKMAATDTLYTFEKSQKLMAEAKTLMPGGVSSPVRYTLSMHYPV